VEDGVFGRAGFFKNGGFLLAATASDQRRLERNDIVKRVRCAIDATMRLARKKP